MSKIDASAVYPVGAMLHELAQATPLVIVTADGQRHTGPADFTVKDGVATLTYANSGGVWPPNPAAAENTGVALEALPYSLDPKAWVNRTVPPASDGTPE